MSIVQHLVIDQYGAFLGKHSERLIVTKGDKKIALPPQIPRLFGQNRFCGTGCLDV